MKLSEYSKQMQYQRNPYIAYRQILPFIIIIFLLNAVSLYQLQYVNIGIDFNLYNYGGNIDSGNKNNGLEFTCQNNSFRRNAIIHPEMCTTHSADQSSISMIEQVYRKEQFTLWNESVRSRNNAAFSIPCGARCVYHFDSAFSYQYGHPIYGWELREVDIQENYADKVPYATGCWEPFNSLTDDSACVMYEYNKWIGDIENSKVSPRTLPTYNPQIIADQMKEYHQKCSTDSESEDALNHAPFCHPRSYEGSHRTVDTNEPVGFRPSTVVHLINRNQLGLRELSDALTLMNETFAHFPLSTLCHEQSPSEQSMLCIYHRHSIPRANAVDGQYGSKVPIKGWFYRTSDRCFIPIDNMEDHLKCGRRSEYFNIWSMYMTKRQQRKALEEETSNRSIGLALTRCDRLPLSLGRNTWDSNSDEFVFEPPLPTSGPPKQDGVQYSAESICGPRILVIGAMKCGTNTIGTLLSHHPRVKISRCTNRKANCDPLHFLAGKTAIWESHGLSHKYNQDRPNYIANYAKKFPVTDEYEVITYPNGTSTVGRGSLTFDKSPSYLNTDIFPNIAYRAKQLLPHAKIIVSLCHPVERMYSEFHHNLRTRSRTGYEQFFTNQNITMPTNFTELVNFMTNTSKVCIDNPNFCEFIRRDRLRTGHYYEHIMEWRNAYGAEHVLVLHMSDTNYHKMKQITSFMDPYLPDHEYPWDRLLLENSEETTSSKQFVNTAYDGRSTGSVEHIQVWEWLQQYYHDHNIALATEINADWPLEWNL